jgi:hypothetical protein
MSRSHLRISRTEKERWEAICGTRPDGWVWGPCRYVGMCYLGWCYPLRGKRHFGHNKKLIWRTFMEWKDIYVSIYFSRRWHHWQLLRHPMRLIGCLIIHKNIEVRHKSSDHHTPLSTSWDSPFCLLSAGLPSFIFIFNVNACIAAAGSMHHASEINHILKFRYLEHEWL